MSRRSGREQNSILVQAFLNFDQTVNAAKESIHRRQSLNTSFLLTAAAVSTAAATTAATASPLASGVVIHSPTEPLLLRLADRATASDAAISALQHHYNTQWAARAQTIIQELSTRDVRPSEQLAAELSQLPRRGLDPAASTKPRRTGDGAPMPTMTPGSGRRQSTMEVRKEKKQDMLIRALLQTEETHFYESVLPSRFLEDYVVSIALPDGTAPSAERHGAMTTGSTYRQQCTDGAEDRRHWLVAAQQRLTDHPKATFPYTISVVYQPTKRSRTLNEVMSRSASFVATSDAARHLPHSNNNHPFLSSSLPQPSGGPTLESSCRSQSQPVAQTVHNKDPAPHHAHDPHLAKLVALTGPGGGSATVGSEWGLQFLRQMVRRLAVQATPKNMLDDEDAKERGYTVLPFLPVLKKARDPLNSFMARGMEDLMQPVPNAAALALSMAEAEDEQDKDDVDVTFEEILRASGLSIYDVARYGTGALAASAKATAKAESAQLLEEDLRRRREAAVKDAERRQEERIERETRLADARELTLREQFTQQQALARQAAEKSELDRARERDAHERGKEARRLAKLEAIEASKKNAEEALKIACARQVPVDKQIEQTLAEKDQRRFLSSTLKGEQLQAEAKSRALGPLSLKLTEFLPKVKSLDQAERQAHMLTHLVARLDGESQKEVSQLQKVNAVEAAQRTAYERRMRDEAVVREADSATLSVKCAALGDRVRSREQQERLALRSLEEVPVLQLMSRPVTSYNPNGSLLLPLSAASSGVGSGVGGFTSVGRLQQPQPHPLANMTTVIPPSRGSQCSFGGLGGTFAEEEDDAVARGHGDGNRSGAVSAPLLRDSIHGTSKPNPHQHHSSVNNQTKAPSASSIMEAHSSSSSIPPPVTTVLDSFFAQNRFEKESAFERWKEERRLAEEAKWARKELGVLR